MSHVDAVFIELQALGAGEFKHFNGSLATHLRGTESLLRQWSAREALCLAGLYHAVYGTDGYAPSLVSIGVRSHVSTLIGKEAEEITYLYCACDRRAFYPRIGTVSQCLFADRFTGTEYEISAQQVSDLCELIVANELDIAKDNEEFRTKHSKTLSELFGRMDGLASAAALQAYKSVLC
jgi:hypothetical protein